MVKLTFKKKASKKETIIGVIVGFKKLHFLIMGGNQKEYSISFDNATLKKMPIKSKPSPIVRKKIEAEIYFKFVE